MKTPMIRIFGYGSLMSENNLKERTPNAMRVGWAELRDHVAIFAKEGTAHQYLTLQRTARRKAKGVLIDVDPESLARLAQHEPGYDLLEITEFISRSEVEETTRPVYSFIAPVRPINPEKATIRRSYINKCIANMDPEEAQLWLRGVIIPYGVSIDEAA